MFVDLYTANKPTSSKDDDDDDDEEEEKKFSVFPSEYKITNNEVFDCRLGYCCKLEDNIGSDFVCNSSPSIQLCDLYAVRGASSSPKYPEFPEVNDIPCDECVTTKRCKYNLPNYEDYQTYYFTGECVRQVDNQCVDLENAIVPRCNYPSNPWC